MVQGYCSRLVGEAKNHYYIISGGFKNGHITISVFAKFCEANFAEAKLPTNTVLDAVSFVL